MGQHFIVAQCILDHDEADAGRAEALHGRANELCFIANSVNFVVRHEPTTLRDST
jgi:organic hydroperoxide reductase OsmC/OhrA